MFLRHRRVTLNPVIFIAKKKGYLPRPGMIVGSLDESLLRKMYTRNIMIFLCTAANNTYRNNKVEFL